MLLTIAIWLVLLLLYVGKWLWARADALAEFEHPVLCCFISLVPVSTMFVALAIAPYSRAIAITLFVVGTIGQLSFGVYRSGQLCMGGRVTRADSTAAATVVVSTTLYSYLLGIHPRHCRLVAGILAPC